MVQLSFDEISAVGASLEDAGVTAKVLDEKEGGWMTTMEVAEYPGQRQSVLLLLPKKGDYFICFTPILSKSLKGTLANLKRGTLETLLKVSSSVRLAKLEYAETPEGGFFFASADCAFDGYSGPKLRARMLACATLAARMKAELG